MGRYDLDVRDLQKIPAPPKPVWFDEELSRLMPRNAFGESYLRMEWGMDAVQFRNANPNAPLEVAAHRKDVQRIWRRLNLVEGQYEYFKTRDEAIGALNIRLSENLDYKNYKTITLFGPPRWQLTGWLAPERFGTPEAWERNRYADIETRIGKFPRVDVNGPFPSRGQYRLIWTVMGPTGEFRDLDRGVMAECERRAYEHKKLESERNDHTDAQELSDEYAHLRAAEEEEQQRIEEDFLEHIGPGGRRRLEGGIWSGYGGTAASAIRTEKPGSRLRELFGL